MEFKKEYMVDFVDYIDNELSAEYRTDGDGYRDDQGVYYDIYDLWDMEQENFIDYMKESVC